MSQRVTWSAVAPGDLVLGARDGKEWSVVALTADEVTLQHDQRTVTVPTPPGAVVRLATAAEVHERALAVVQVVLGGTVVAKAPRPAGEKGHECPATFTQPSALAGHIYLFHGQPDAWGYPGGRWGSGRADITDPASTLTMADLVGMHDYLHEEMAKGNARAGTITHWHSPTFDKDGL